MKFSGCAKDHSLDPYVADCWTAVVKVFSWRVDPKLTRCRWYMLWILQNFSHSIIFLKKKIYYICLKSISTFFSDLRGLLWRLWRILKLKNEEVRICSKNSETRYITSVDRYYPLWRSTTAQNRPNLFFVIRLVHKLQNYSWLTLYQVFIVFKP